MGIKADYSGTDAHHMFLMLSAIATMLVLIYAMIHILWPSMPWGPLRDLFDLDKELSIPTWFSSMQLFALGSLLFLVSRNNQRRQQLPTSLLIAGSLLFVFLSADESAAIHEKITTVFIKLGIKWMLFNGNHGAWISVYSILALAVIIVAARHLRGLWRYFRHEIRIALLGAIVFVSGGVGFEVMGYLFLGPGSNKRLYKVEVVCEEYLEMIGVSIMLYAVLLLAETVSIKSCLPEPAGIPENTQPLGADLT